MHATEQCDIARMERLIAQMRASQPALADQFSALTASFEYDAILGLLQGEADAEIIPPPPEELAALAELAALGKVFEIQSRVESLEAQDARYRPFARKIWALAQAFEDARIAELVKSYLEQA